MSSLKAVLMNKQAYWKTRTVVLRVLFFGKKIFYQAHYFLNNQKTSMHVQRTLIFHTLKKIAFASIVLFILYGLDYFAFDILSFRNPLSVENTQILTDTLIAALSISGIFLGLYFSNMASVYSTRYANAPASVRRLFENEIVTSKSVNDIILFIVISIVTLILSLFGIILKPITICFIFFLSIKNIVSFAVIGKRSFQFSDVYEIATPLYKNIRDYYMSCTFKGVFFRDVNFQSHYQSSASKCIDNLSTITSYSIESNMVKSTSMLTFMCKNLEAIREYWGSKSSIPFDSKWFPSKEVYKKWFEADDTEVKIAMETGTSIPNRVEMDSFWFENRMFAINDLCFDTLVKTKNWDALYNYLSYSSNLVDASLASGCSSYFLDKVNQTMNKIQMIIFENKAEKAPSYLKLIDIILICYIEFYIGSYKYIESIEPDVVVINFSQGKIGLLTNPVLNTQEIRKLHECVVAEKKIERHQITPEWYVQQFIATKILESIFLLVNDLKKIYTLQLVELVEENIKHKCYTEALLILSRMTELKAKFSFCIQAITPVIKALNALHKDSSLKWPIDSLESILESYCATEKTLPQFWVKASVAFSVENESNLEQYPDLIGHCYNVLCDFLIMSISTNDFAAFESAYSKFWSLMLLYQEITRRYLLENKDDQEESLIFKIFAFPMVEFCMISGFAILWGGVLNNSNWLDLVNTIRDQIASRNDNESNVFEKMIKIVSATDISLPAMYPRDILHTGWGMLIMNALRENDSIQFEEYGYFGEKRIKTDDLFIKAYLPYDLDMIGPSPVYELYLIKCINPSVSAEQKYRSRSYWERELV